MIASEEEVTSSALPTNDEQTLKILRDGLRGLEWVFRSVVNFHKITFKRFKNFQNFKIYEKKVFFGILVL